ncbi:hypothetical protein BMS3Bbin10_00695 [bacterium BMS3Bbin10]|nr:hypothetical protein BMS3Bbin10_00695 [bacterium BMS3Bbin10]
MTATVSIPIGVVIAREDIDSKWEDHVWRPIGVLPGAAEIERWKEIGRGEGWEHYHAATVPMELFRKETESYKYNLEAREPVVYIVLSDDDDESGDPVSVHLVTASPDEAADYLDSGELIVEPVAMPPELIALVSDFVAKHHVEEKFKKRKNTKMKLEEHKFGQEPIFEMRRRMGPMSEYE